jgi:hypothetical protein
MGDRGLRVRVIRGRRHRLVHIVARQSVAITSVGLVLVGIGNGMLIPGVTNAAMRDIPPDFVGTASGVLNTARQTGTSIGLSVLGTISASVSAATWARGLPQPASAAAALATRKTRRQRHDSSRVAWPGQAAPAPGQLA